MEKQSLLIGVDGGATKVSVWQIEFNDPTKTFGLGKHSATKSYSEIKNHIPDYIPVNIQVQLNERDAEIKCTAPELQQAEVYVEACALAIAELANLCETNKVLIGIGMPGLKTADKRGIAVVANGPRMVNYAEMLEKRLAGLKVQLVSPISHLGSDADYCGIGENYADNGIFRDADNAYYLGGGTGVADAMKLNGELVTFDEAKEWMAKTWEMKSNEGLPLERVTSVSGMQLTYAEFAGKTVEELNRLEIFPLQIAALAKQGDAAALKTFKVVNRNLATLLYERITTLNVGWSDLFAFGNPNKPSLKKKHSFNGKVFDTLVIGQRLGDLFDDENGTEIVKRPVLQQLDHLIQNSSRLKECDKLHYSNLDKIIKVSKLREAPALGAGVDAFLTKKL